MTLVDTNVLIDVLGADARWSAWSEEKLIAAASEDELAINPIIYAEAAADFPTQRDLDRALRDWPLHRLPLPHEAGFLAGQALVRYRRQGGQRRSPLPDFYIGAHAQTAGLTLLTRDATRYRTYFPKLRLIAPE